MLLTRTQLERFAPPPPARSSKRAIWDAYVDALVSHETRQLMADVDITTPARLHYLLATWHVETGGFTVIRENMAYSAAGLVRVFGRDAATGRWRHSARITEAEAQRLAGNGYAIAERVYGLGNPTKAAELGNTQRGDGWRFRGAGIQQITGRAAHEAMASRVGCALDALEQPLNSIHAALIEWAEKRCNEAADRGDTLATRTRINGGTAATVNGLPEFRAQIAAAARIFTGDNDNAEYASASDGAVDMDFALGDEGPRVAALQRDLAAAGYPCGAADGRFGTLTERAVAGFQVSHGLPGTGRADRATLDVLAARDPADVIPGRATATSDEIKARGSSTLTILARVRAAITGLKVSMGGLLGGEALGLQPIDQALGLIEQIRGYAGRLGAALGVTIPMKVVIALAALGALAWLGGALGRLWAARVEDHRSGASLGR